MSDNFDEGELLWVVHKALPWKAVKTENGILLTSPEEGPHRFIPVFNTREQAVKWNNDSDDDVYPIVPKKGEDDE
jgi:hypothetical protein